jgi:hypothetical protein
MSDHAEICRAIDFISSELTETRCQLRQALQDISDALNVPTPKRVRNEAAVCGNCPYYKPNSVGDLGACCVTSEYPSMYKYQWCGKHPDFWRES